MAPSSGIVSVQRMSSVLARFVIRQRPEALAMEFNADETTAEVKQLLSADVRHLKANRRILDDTETIGSVVLSSHCAIVVSPEAIPTVERPRAEPTLPVGLPQRGGRWDRKGVEPGVNALAGLGYTCGQCERALDAACYNIDRAAEYLICGQISGD